VVSIKLVKGTLQVTRKYVRETDYTVKNSDGKSKTVLVEQPFETGWKLVTPQEPAEKTRDLYRFAVTAEPGKPARLAVVEEQVVQETLALSNLDDGAIVFFSNQNSVSPEVKAALLDVIKRKQALQHVTQQREQLVGRIAEITSEQERIRQNMGQLDRNSELYRRYVQKFGDQETSVEKMRAEIEKLTTEENRLRASLDEHLVNLTL
jgi:chromosome segregation ATPase